MKGRRFSGGTLRASGTFFWHNIDKLGWETGVGKQQVKAGSLLEPTLAFFSPNARDHDFKSCFDIKNDRGEVIFFLSRLPGNARVGGPAKLRARTGPFARRRSQSRVRFSCRICGST
ncbi:unnamed protein product [Prorocentrum cordatum]|uniref:FACT complex subunit SSRP1 n=1 Tax=Prorocentrum cordatum TaxID=2364126 RepID=A0ABN9X6H8_9DINO|nr:unnamed protein product [Polarella glacialis]